MGFHFKKRRTAGSDKGNAQVPETGRTSVKVKPLPDPNPRTDEVITSFVGQTDAVCDNGPATDSIFRRKYCPSCHEEIPLDATKCPHCGRKWSDNDPRLLVEGIIFVAAVLFAVAGVLLKVSQWL